MKYNPIVDVPLVGQPIVDSQGLPSEQFQKLLETIQESINVTIYTVATVPVAADNEGKTIIVSDESGGYTMAFSDSTNWRRVQDRAIIS